MLFVGTFERQLDDKGRLAKNFKGYDISPDMVRLSLVNLYLHGFTDPHIFDYDTLTSEERWNEFADVILDQRREPVASRLASGSAAGSRINDRL